MITEKVIIESLSEVINKKNKVIVIYSGLWTFINKIKFNNTNIAKTILNLIEKFIGEDRTLIIPSFSSECFLKNRAPQTHFFTSEHIILGYPPPSDQNLAKTRGGYPRTGNL